MPVRLGERDEGEVVLVGVLSRQHDGDVVGHVEQSLGIGTLPLAIKHAGGDFRHPETAFTAGRTLATALVGVKLV